MVFTAVNQPARRRGRAKRVTEQELSAYYSMLRSAADGGDVQAASVLIALAEERPLLPVANRAAGGG
tara:strand:+ start:5559 stop:5759 length:201 start_codon:yes stop_codon:yes gene_type:complete